MPRSSNFWASVTIMFSGLLWAVTRLSMTLSVPLRINVGFNMLMAASLLLLALGFVRIIVVYKEHNTRPQRVSLLVAFAGLLEMLIGSLSMYWMGREWLWPQFLSGAVTVSVGLLVFGISSDWHQEFGGKGRAYSIAISFLLLSPFASMALSHFSPLGRLFYWTYGLLWPLAGLFWLLWGYSLKDSSPVTTAN